MDEKTLLKIGGVTGIILGVVQLAGIVMHGSIPTDPAEGLAFISHHTIWPITHILLITSYLMVVGFYVGMSASFRNPPATLAIARNLILVGAFLGAVHFTIHFALYPYAAEQYHAAAGTPLGDKILLLYSSFHPYAHALNRCSFFLLMVTAVLFSMAVLKEERYPRWMGILGIVGAVVTLVSVFFGELYLSRSATDIVFAVTLLPTIVWIVAVSIAMLRMRPISGVPT